MASTITANAISNRARLSCRKVGTSRLALSLAMGSVAFAVVALPAVAAETDWSGTTSTDWFDASNWNNGTPTAAEDAVIGTTSPNATTINANAAAAGVYIGVTAVAPGALTISGAGTLTSTNGIVGNGPASLVTVDGAGSAWTNATTLNIGSSGIGALVISQGGIVTDATGTLGNFFGSSGSATVINSNSAWNNSADFRVGNFGNGALLIANGGAVRNDNGYVGKEAGSTGIVAVNGSGSTWTNTSTLFVGDSGTGSLTVSGGGTVTSAEAVLGEVGTGTGTVTGTGSSWTNAGNIVVGDNGTGTFNVLNGAVATNVTGHVAFGAGSTGRVTVDGVGSTWANSGIFLGTSGVAELTIANGGTVSAPVGFIMATLAASTATLNIGAAIGSAATGAGTLNTAMVQFGDGRGTLNFNHTNAAYTFAPVINGANGTINQIAGTTILATNSSTFTGATNVTGGRLAVNGSLAGSIVSVSGSGTLGGNGTVGGIVAQSGGIIGPGNSIGTLNVAGNLSQAAGSVYQVELTSTGMSDLIHATGTATLASGALIDVVKLDAAPYVPGTHYMVLQADGGITGTYTIAGQTGSAFLGLVDRYDATHLYLDVIAKTFAQVGLTPNQIATGAGAESLGAGAAVYDAIAVLPTAAIAQAAFDQLSGEIHASTRTAMIEDSRFLREAAMDRLRAMLGDNPAGPRNDQAGGDEQPGVWARGFGAQGQWNGDGNAATMIRNTGGLFVGADGVVGNNWRLGVIGGYSHSDLAVGPRNSWATSNDYHVGLYGGTEWGNLAFRSGLAYTWHDIGTTRAAAFPGFANTLTGDYGAGTTQAFGELGYRFEIEDAMLEPFANLAYVNLATGGFSERGGVGALDVAAGGSNTGFTTLGLRASTSFTPEGGVTLTARGMIGWRHAIGDTTPTSGMAFPGGSAFTIAGVPMAGDAVLVDLGLDLSFRPNVTLGLAYAGQFGAASTDQTIRGTLNAKF